MVHPTELLRTDSNAGREFSAPRILLDSDQIDCGFKNFPILNRCFNLEKYAKPRVFLTFLSLVGFLQGVTLTYFRDTSTIWDQHYNISKGNIEWLIYTNEFFVGIIALTVAYWGNRIHRTSWIGGLTIFQAISSAILIIPEIYRRNQKNMTDHNLCKIGSSPSLPDEEINYVALTVLVVFQIFYAMASISFITHGITYIDDNSPKNQSAGYIGIALACKELGRQAGLYLSFIPSLFKTDAIFFSPVWLTLAVIVFISGLLISMFPRHMPSALMEQVAASIVDLASGQSAPVPKQKIDGFFKTLFRLLKNKVLMVNIMTVTSVQSGLINFDIFEKYFNQSRFQISSTADTSYTYLTTNLLKQPLVAISMVAAGMIIAKTNPHLKSLVKWNIVALVLVIIFFGSTAFLKCETSRSGKPLTRPCDFNCNCTFDEFQPICLDSMTYYSPCVANCTTVEEYDSKRIYNCYCGKKFTATDGACNSKKCDLYYGLSQGNRVITTALLASTIITNLIINMRCILSRDKAVALGLEATFSTLIPFLPIKAIYGAVSEEFCLYDKGKNKVCKLYKDTFGLFLSISTIGFIFLALILSIIVFLLLKFYPNQLKTTIDDDEDDDVEMEEVEDRRREENRLMNDQDDNSKGKIKGSTESITGSLLEMENVGDDHDSVDSASHLDDYPDRPRQRRIIESDL